MKISILFFAFLATSVMLGQEMFTYNQDGLNPEHLVVNVENQTQQELFDKSINWIKETYKNPEEVIKTTIDNEKIRFEGVEMDLMCHSALGSTFCYNTSYVIDLEFKEGKYKFSPLAISYRIPETSMIETINFSSGENYFNRKGKLKGRTKTVPESVENLLNGLSTSLKNYLVKDKSTSDW